MLFDIFAVAACALAVVNAAPGGQVPMTAQCTTTGSGILQTQIYPPVGRYLIGNVELGGALLFENTSGAALVDFRRIGGHGNNIFWDIRDVPDSDGKSTIWNVGTGNPISLEDKFTDNGALKATEFVLKSAGYPFFTFEAPVSRKLWDFYYVFDQDPRYPEYAGLTLREAPTDNDRISIFWQLSLV